MVRNIGLLIVMFLAFGLLVFWLAKDEDTHPCAHDQRLGRCYQVERDVCVKQWTQFDQECRKQIEALNLPPARLVGPIMDRCIASKYDRVFHYMRAQSSQCETEHRELETWRKTNPGF